jgi:hypothetical protein
MMKIALAVVAAAAVLTTTPLVTPAKAQGVDVQIGRDRYDRYDTTVGLGPGGVTIAHDSAAAWRQPRLNGTTAA